MDNSLDSRATRHYGRAPHPSGAGFHGLDEPGPPNPEYPSFYGYDEDGTPLWGRPGTEAERRTAFRGLRQVRLPGRARSAAHRPVVRARQPRTRTASAITTPASSSQGTPSSTGDCPPSADSPAPAPAGATFHREPRALGHRSGSGAGGRSGGPVHRPLFGLRLPLLLDARTARGARS